MNNIYLTALCIHLMHFLDQFVLNNSFANSVYFLRNSSDFKLKSKSLLKDFTIKRR